MYTYDAVKSELKNNKKVLLLSSKSLDNVSNYLASVFTLYENVLKTNNNSGIIFYDLFLNACHVKNIEFQENTNTQKIFERIFRLYPNGSEIYKHNKFKKLSISFDKCIFDFLSITQNTNSPIIASVVFNKCKILNLSLNSNNNGYSYELKMNKCDIDSTKVYGQHSKPALFNRIIFSQCKFTLDFLVLRTPIFGNTLRFDSCEFYNSPKFHGAKFHVDTSFSKSKFLNTKSEDSVGDYRVLKILTQEISSDHDSMIFHALEMESRRRNQLPFVLKIWDSRCVETASSWLLKLINNYGRNFWLPFLWLVFILFCFTYLYQSNSGVECNSFFKERSAIWVQDFCNVPDTTFEKSFIFSLNRTLGPLGLFLDSGLISAQNIQAKVYSFIQIILSTIIWFIWVMQIRRQFKL